MICSIVSTAHRRAKMITETTPANKPPLTFSVAPASGERIEVIAGAYKGETGKVTDWGAYGYTLFWDNGMTYGYFQTAPLRRIEG